MKKTLIAVAAAAALATSSAFAEVTFGAWLRTVVAPVASDGDEIRAGMTNSWGGLRTARLNSAWVSEDEKAGMKLDIYCDSDSYTFSSGDHAYMYVRPIEQIRLSVGKYGDNDTGIRGDLAYGSWNWMRPNNWVCGDEGLTFDDLSANTGLRLELFPVEGLEIVGSIPYSSSFKTAEDVYKGANVAAVYSIEGIGRIKVGYFGNYKKYDEKAKAGKSAHWENKDGDPIPTPTDYITALTNGYKFVAATEPSLARDAERLGDIEVAFDLTAVENLYVTAGFKYSIADSEYWNEALSDAEKAADELRKANKEVEGYYLRTGFTPNMKIALGASYQVTDDFKVSASGAVFFYDYKDIDIDPRFQAGLGVDYSLGSVVEGLALAADVRYVSETKGEDDGAEDDSFSFMVGATKSVGSNGVIGIGFQGVTNAYGLSGALTYFDESKPDEGKFSWAIPVQVSIWF